MERILELDNGSDEDMDFRIKDNFLLFSGFDYFMLNGAKGHHWVFNGNCYGYFNGYGTMDILMDMA